MITERIDAARGHVVLRWSFATCAILPAAMYSLAAALAPSDRARSMSPSQAGPAVGVAVHPSLVGPAKPKLGGALDDSPSVGCEDREHLCRTHRGELVAERLAAVSRQLGVWDTHAGASVQHHSAVLSIDSA